MLLIVKAVFQHVVLFSLLFQSLLLDWALRQLLIIRRSMTWPSTLVTRMSSTTCAEIVLLPHLVTPCSFFPLLPSSGFVFFYFQIFPSTLCNRFPISLLYSGCLASIFILCLLCVHYGISCSNYISSTFSVLQYLFPPTCFQIYPPLCDHWCPFLVAFSKNSLKYSRCVDFILGYSVFALLSQFYYDLVFFCLPLTWHLFFVYLLKCCLCYLRSNLLYLYYIFLYIFLYRVFLYGIFMYCILLYRYLLAWYLFASYLLVLCLLVSLYSHNIIFTYRYILCLYLCLYLCWLQSVDLLLRPLFNEGCYHEKYMKIWLLYIN